MVIAVLSRKNFTQHLRHFARGGNKICVFECNRFIFYLQAIFKCSLEYIRPGEVTVGQMSDAKDSVDAGIPFISSIG